MLFQCIGLIRIRNENSKNPDINIGTDQYNASSSTVIDPCDRNLYWIYDRNLSRKQEYAERKIEKEMTEDPNLSFLFLSY